MRTRVKDIFNQALGVRTNFCRQAHKALRCPFGPFLMGFGHVFFDRAVTPLVVTADVTGHPFAFVEAFDGVVCDAHIDFLFNQRVGNAVIMAVDFDVIVHIDRGFFPLGELVGLRGQRIKCGPIHAFKGGLSAAGQLLKGLVIEIFKQLGNGLI